MRVQNTFLFVLGLILTATNIIANAVDAFSEKNIDVSEGYAFAILLILLSLIEHDKEEKT